MHSIPTIDATEPRSGSVTKAAGKQHKLRGPLARSKVTNGERLLLGNADERSQFARRLRDIMALHVEDLSGGAGADSLSEAQLSLIRRASVLELRLEEMEAQMAAGEKVETDAYGRACGHVRRMFETLGMRRVKKTIVPTLHSYVKKHANDPVDDDE